MASVSTLRFGAHTDEMTSLLRVVNLVRTGEASTRPEIGRITGLGRGVVAQRVDLATELGYLEDAEYGPSSGGRAPRTLRFRAEQGRIVICALGALHINVGLAALEGDIIDRIHEGWDVARGPEVTLRKATELIDELLSRDSSAAPVWAIVVGLPGPVDFATGRPVAPPIMPGWNDYDVRQRFEDRYGAPVWVDNDVNLLACSERARWREERPDLIYCKIGSGIGAGLLSRGQIHRGANGAAGDIGHVRVAGSDAPCRCGKTGCLEAVAGGWALVRDAKLAIADGAVGILATRLDKDGSISPGDIARAADDGDALAISLIMRAARVVGEAIAALVNMFNPGVIVIGGVVTVAGELFLAGVRQRVYELSLPLATRDLMIVQAVDDERQPLRGGADLAREQLFDVTFPRWFAERRPSVDVVRGSAFAA